MVKVTVLATLFCVGLTSAMASQPVKLETTMKTMGFAFRQATEASTTAEALPFLEKLHGLTQQAKMAPMPSDKAAVFNEGLDKVLAELVLAKQAVANDDMAKLQQHLKQVDALKKQYHKKRRFSFWQLIFGKV
ncbi:cytochrome b562 [Alishewanella sp. d11]|uniref:cytochrome b562 n=1 Tax=Alishewanella sp. d11 TaxID=3414030 RepID=UPI003BF823F9